MRDFSKVKRIIVKIGSSSLVNSDLSMNTETVEKLMKAFSKLREKGIETALVSSGAIALGMHALGLAERPRDISLQQACAAVGQAKLMEAYNTCAAKYHLLCGQILVNHDDFQIRKRMLYLCDTLDAMFKNQILPIINENDALAVEEIKVGDNDTLSALLVPMIKANLLILFSDIDGLYTKNPKLYPDARKIDEVQRIDDTIFQMAGLSSSKVGTGGMQTKLNAAVISNSAGGHMIICNASELDRLEEIVQGNCIGTLFLAKNKGISSREHWIIFKAGSQGCIRVDEGLRQVFLTKKVSVLPKGIVSVEGSFLKHTVIDIRSEDGKLLAKGITNYSSMEIEKIKGENSVEMEKSPDKYKRKEVIHANNLVMIQEDMRC